MKVLLFCYPMLSFGQLKNCFWCKLCRRDFSSWVVSSVLPVSSVFFVTHSKVLRVVHATTLVMLVEFLWRCPMNTRNFHTTMPNRNPSCHRSLKFFYLLYLKLSVFSKDKTKRAKNLRWCLNPSSVWSRTRKSQRSWKRVLHAWSSLYNPAPVRFLEHYWIGV